MFYKAVYRLFHKHTFIIKKQKRTGRTYLLHPSHLSEGEGKQFKIKDTQMNIDIFNPQTQIEIEGEKYTLLYDNQTYAALEQKTGKGVLALFDEILTNKAALSVYIDIAVFGVKNGTSTEAAEKIKTLFEQKPYLIMQNLQTICAAFLVPLTPPESLHNLQNKNKDGLKKKKTRKTPPKKPLIG